MTCAACDHPRGWHLHDGVCLWLTTGPGARGCSCNAYLAAVDVTAPDHVDAFVTCACGHSNLRHSAALPRRCYSCGCPKGWASPDKRIDR